ncbi:MAG: dicarboxylate/amino acid:cation symporter, partial [Bdellovibrionales bacterium]|nr:dicarboxylate/amino acid:cation symporter [Bdellovibrionales bacterium]
MAWYKQLHWRIIIGLLLGLVYGLIAATAGWDAFTTDWIAPFGTIFVNLLKLIAVPLVLASLTTGVASLSDLNQLSRMGGKTIAIYLVTTLIAVLIGLILVNITQPGKSVPTELRDRLQASYQADIEDRTAQAKKAKDRGPLQPLVDMVPSNLFESASSNRNMLQIVFISILFGIGLIQVNREKAQVLIDIFHTLNDVIIRMVDLIMIMAPVGVFALIAKTITSVTAGGSGGSVLELVGALGLYCLTVIAGLGIHAFVVLPTLLRTLSPMNFVTFIKGIAPAQLLAFSTSSSGATLPLTMERCEEKLGVSEEVSSFVLPLGATINMDGTALYQAVAAVFIAQALRMDLTWGQQAMIVFTAVLASIGTAAVPSAGIIMLVVILEAIGVPSAGIALM